MNAVVPSHALLIQGNLLPNAAHWYQAYLRGTGPLMQRYQIQVGAVGGSWLPATSPSATSWDINAILLMPAAETAARFLLDPEYLRLKTTTRHRAYAELHMHYLPLILPWQPVPNQHVIACCFSKDASQPSNRADGSARWLADGACTCPEGGDPLGARLTIVDLGPRMGANLRFDSLMARPNEISAVGDRWHFFETRTPRMSASTTTQGDSV